MDIVIISVLALIVGLAFGWTLAAAFYATKIREAFGLGQEVQVLGWLHTKAVKRGIDGRKTPPLR